MTTTDFLHAEGPVGTGAGGNTPRRLIPSRFHGAAVSGESEDWTGSLFRIAVVLAITAAASLAMSQVLDRTPVRSAVIKSVDLPAPSGDARPTVDRIHGHDTRADTRAPHHHAPRPSELFE